MNAVVPHNGQEFRQSTDAAGLCGAIVKQTASNIQGRRYVSVEGWQAIAIAHGCAAGSRDVEKVEGGVRAIGEVRRMEDGQVIATAEGFVGEDEPTWYGGKNKWGKEEPKRPDYAIRAMAQTRAISRACRSAFAHVVVMIDAGLSTTPAEEVPDDGFDGPPMKQARDAAPQKSTEQPSGMPDAEYAKLANLLKATGVPPKKLLDEYKVKDLRQLSQHQYADAIERLNNVLADKAKQQTNAAQPAEASANTFGELLDDEVPF